MSTAVVAERIESTKGMNGKPLKFALHKISLILVTTAGSREI